MENDDNHTSTAYIYGTTFEIPPRASSVTSGWASPRRSSTTSCWGLNNYLRLGMLNIFHVFHIYIGLSRLVRFLFIYCISLISLCFILFYAKYYRLFFIESYVRCIIILGDVGDYTVIFEYNNVYKKKMLRYEFCIVRLI